MRKAGPLCWAPDASTISTTCTLECRSDAQATEFDIPVIGSIGVYRLPSFVARTGPEGAPFPSKPGSLEHWLTERYALFSTDRRGRLYRGDIHHAQWPLQLARAEFELNTMTEQIGIELPRVKPSLHFAKSLEVLVWTLTPVRPS